jgi:deoxyribonuclease-4
VWLGAHVSISKGLAHAVKMAVEMQGNTMQFFSRNPRGGKARDLDMAEIMEAHLLMKKHNFGAVVAHAPYIINLASPKEHVRNFSLRIINDDLARIKVMEVPFLVLHVGTHGGQGVERGLTLVTEALKEILAEIPDDTQILLEGMAGEGTELGNTFEQLAEILERCGDHPGLGICLDTCHMTGHGYDLSALDGIKETISRTVGWQKVKVLHLNDSMYPLGSKRDRHARLGEGYLGLETVRKIVCDREFGKLLFILETPNDQRGYAAEIALVRELCQR